MPRIGYWASQVNVFWTLDVRCGGDTEYCRANKIVVATELHFVWFKITPTGTPIASLPALAEKTDALAA